LNIFKWMDTIIRILDRIRPQEQRSKVI